nr:SPRY domain-containing SOCS box protein 3 isoform X1 [Leptinotarsa decemlineata]
MYWVGMKRSLISRSTEQNKEAPSFCEGCEKTAGLLKCHCGEDREVQWCWSNADASDNLSILEDSREILFHPTYSCGTAVVRGRTHFEQNKHHFWEVKMVSIIYGTDMMIGVGTKHTHLSEWTMRFGSMLGIDSQSWGYSYRGRIQHDNLLREYGLRYGQGTLIGVHLNMYKGTLEYHINRKPVGIAFTQLKDKELYPMISSTAAQSSMRIICSVSEESTLQMLCVQIVCKHPSLYNKYKEIPGLMSIYGRKYCWIVPTDEEKEEKERLAKLEDDVHCSGLDRIVKRRKNRYTSSHCASVTPETSSGSK